MSHKIVLIGGGSYNWTRTLAKDLFLRPQLAGATLTLVDIDPGAAQLLEAYCRKLAAHAGSGWNVETAGLDAALDGADVVGVSISTGDLDAMAVDYHVPEAFGIYHTVSDTVGPGGISRALRNIPVFADFAQRMEQRCPRAWMVHVTNPLAQLTRAVWKCSSIRSVGLCHNYAGTTSFLADYMRFVSGDDTITHDDIHAVSVGVNHGSLLKDITCRGKNIEETLSMKTYLEYQAAKSGDLQTGTTDDQIEAMLAADQSIPFYINFELFEIFGIFPVGSCPHVAENWPFFLNDPDTIRRHHIRRKGVLPGRRNGKMKNRDRIRDVVEGREELGELHASREGFSVIAEALLSDETSCEMVNLPNTGQVTNLPPDVVVETWGTVSRDSIVAEPAGPIPEGLLGFMQMVVDEEETTVAAALTGDRDLLRRALFISPMVQNKDCIDELAEKLLDGNRQWLGRFFR